MMRVLWSLTETDLLHWLHPMAAVNPSMLQKVNIAVKRLIKHEGDSKPLQK